MILLYATRTTARLTYILDVFLEQIAGYQYRFTDQWSEFVEFDGPKINYSKQHHDSGLWIRAADILFENNLNPTEPTVSIGKYGKVLFPVQDLESCLDFDPLAAAFYLLSLYDEYLPHKLDQHGRIQADDTFVVRHGFVHAPFVENWAMTLQQKILEKYPMLPKKNRQFSFQPTFDIDQAYAFRFKGLKRNILGGLKDLIAGRFQEVVMRMAVLAGKQQDPFDNYEYILKIHDKLVHQPLFFILFGEPGPYDKNLDPRNPEFRKLILKLDCQSHCGIHPSYNTYLDPKLLKEEVSTLSALLSGPVTKSRQHYLKFKMPETFRNLYEAGIKADYSLGFASIPGFRAGNSSPFPFYDLEKDCSTTLMLHPISYMEGTLRDYSDSSPEQAIIVIQNLIHQVKQVSGTFVSLWHNESVGEQGRWKGWRKVYEAMLVTLLAENKG